MRTSPQQSYTNLRALTEKWSWIDPRSKQRVTGYVIPANATEVERVEFYIRFVTKQGHCDEGRCVTLSVDTVRHQRKVKFVQSGEIRIVNDVLVMSVDGVRIITH